MRFSLKHTGLGVYCRRNNRCRRVIYSALLRPPSIILSAKGRSAQRFSKNTFQLIAIRPACMGSAKNIERRQRSMSNTTAPTRKRRKKIEYPMLHLWAQGGWLDTYYAKDGGALGIWRQWAPKVQG